MDYKNYFFDLYGTLVDLRYDEEQDDLWKRLALWYGFHGASYDPRELYEDYHHGVQNRMLNSESAYPDVEICDVFKELYSVKNIQPSNQLIEYTARFFRVSSTHGLWLYEGAVQFLKLLVKRGKRIFLVSNGQRAFSLPEMKFLAIQSYFDGIHFSSDYGICKPDPQFLKEILKTEKCRVEDSVLVGNDHLTDIVCANGVGMDSVYFYTEQSGARPLNSGATYEADSGNLLTLYALLNLTGLDR